MTPRWFLLLRCRQIFVSPSQGLVTQKGQQTFDFGGASGTLPRDQKQALQREDTLHMDPHAKVFPNRQLACDIKQLSFVFNQENMQLHTFFYNIGKMKNVRIRD